MCLYCGGSCAGSGDMLLISLAADVGLAIVKVHRYRSPVRGRMQEQVRGRRLERNLHRTRKIEIPD